MNQQLSSSLSELVSPFPPPPKYFKSTTNWSNIPPPTIPIDQLPVFGRVHNFTLTNDPNESFIDIIEQWNKVCGELLECISDSDASIDNIKTLIEEKLQSLNHLAQLFNNNCHYLRRVQAMQMTGKLLAQEIEHKKAVISKLQSLLNKYHQLSNNK